MKIIITYLSIIVLSLAFTTIQAQEKQSDSTRTIYKELEIKKLIKSKKTVELKEKAFLKEDILAINIRLKKGEVTVAKANSLKTEAAQKRALNIENHLAIIDNEIALWNRTDKPYQLDIRVEGTDNTYDHSAIEEVLECQRKKDEGMGLWEVFNRVQENIIEGNFHYKTKKGKVRQARVIKNFKQDIDLNKGMFKKAMEYAV